MKVSDAAASYIRERSESGSVVILMKAVQGGWCTYQVPSVEIGVPTNPDHFLLETVNGVQVYLEKYIKIHPDGAEIEFSKGLFRKGLRIFGIIPA